MVLFSALFVLTALVPTHAREIQVNLQAPWAHRSVHPLAEVAEFLADQSSGDFWTYVDTLCSTPSSMDTVDAAISSNTEESLHSISQLAQSVGVHIVPSNVENILELASNLGMYMPAVQFYESLAAPTAAPCGAGEAYLLNYPGGVVSCAAALNTSTASASLTDETVNMPWNHEYPFGPDKKFSAYEHSEVLVLYGVIGSTSFCKLHNHLRYRMHGESAI
jgi:hypothetical protein